MRARDYWRSWYWFDWVILIFVLWGVGYIFVDVADHPLW